MTILYRPPPSTLHRAVVGFLAFSVLVIVAAAVSAWRVAPLPGPDMIPESSAVEGLPDVQREPLWTAVRAVERDPFHPQRRAPEARYLLPEGDLGGISPLGAGVAQGSLRLVGTAVSEAGGGFAMCQLGGDPPRIVRIGDTLGGFTLRSVLRGEAEFTREDGSVVTLVVPGTPERSGGPADSTHEELP